MLVLIRGNILADKLSREKRKRGKKTFSYHLSKRKSLSGDA